MLLQCSWVALVFVLVLVLVLEQTRTATANADKQTRPTTFSKTCPEDASPNCHPGNKCTKCHPTCKYCQNLSNDTCDVSDCMVCKDDLFLITKYDAMEGLTYDTAVFLFRVTANKMVLSYDQEEWYLMCSA
eukprot:m.20799 g.20799  ORF g.20799 m.20799 type:complete len:131 (+) comp8205_c0_seq2:86-478(+)